MKQKAMSAGRQGFINAILVIAIVVIVGVAGYFVFVRNSVVPMGSVKIEHEDLDSFDSKRSLSCISTFDLENREKEFIVNNQNEYQGLVKYKSSHLICDDFNLPEIDFSKKTLLGKYTSSGGCSIDFEKKAYMDDSNKKFFYCLIS